MLRLEDCTTTSQDAGWDFYVYYNESEWLLLFCPYYQLMMSPLAERVRESLVWDNLVNNLQYTCADI